ncbi:MAG TPA: efflux RND transporter periplasmic adaptor subunit [Polyangiaceae bacterium]
MKVPSGRAIALCVLAGFACQTEQAEPESQPQRVILGAENVAKVTRTRLSSGPRISGTLEPEERAVIRAEAEGAVRALYVELGDSVRRGTLLLRIDAPELRDAVQSAEAGVRAAEQALVLSKRQLERTQRLTRAGALSQRELEVEQSTVAGARADLENQRAALATARARLKNTTVRSPLSGVVSEQPVHAGDNVSPGSHLLTVIDLSSLRLDATVPAVDLPKLELGLPVEFSVRGYPDRMFEGRIRRIAPAADAVRQVPILVSIQNPSGALLAGLFADGRVLTRSVEAPALPLDAVDREARPNRVLAIRSGKLERVPVQLGLVDEVQELVEIEAGVSEGDVVTTGESRGLTPGAPVALAGAKPSEAAAPPSVTP